jgi:hypothetical protein
MEMMKMSGFTILSRGKVSDVIMRTNILKRRPL